MKQFFKFVGIISILILKIILLKLFSNIVKIVEGLSSE